MAMSRRNRPEHEPARHRHAGGRTSTVDTADTLQVALARNLRDRQTVARYGRLVPTESVWAS
jgi:hypothetical protein